MGLPDSLDVQNTLSLKGGTWEERDPRSQRSVEMNRLPSPTASPKKMGNWTSCGLYHKAPGSPGQRFINRGLMHTHKKTRDSSTFDGVGAEAPQQTPWTAPVSPRLVSSLLILRTVLGAEPRWLLQMRPRGPGVLGEVALSPLPLGTPSSGCKWSEEEFLHRQMEKRRDHGPGTSSLHPQEAGGDVPGGPVVKNLPANAGDMGSIPGSGRFHMLCRATKPVHHPTNEKPPQ